MQEFIDKYNNIHHELIQFKSQFHTLLSELLQANHIKFHQIVGRIKTRESLIKKIQDKKYTDLNQITDIVGCRIITYFDDDVDRIANIIRTEFTIDTQNSTDKRISEVDRFGYKSVHFVVSLSESRKKLTEYTKFGTIKVEIQLRSILQHSWAEIEHDIGYKGEKTQPDHIKRKFSRISALLELADSEFTAIRNEIGKATIIESFKKEGIDDCLNKETINFFILNNESVTTLDNRIAQDLNFEIVETPNDTENLVALLAFLGITTASLLQTTLDHKSECVKEFAPNFEFFKYRYINVPSKKTQKNIGNCLWYLAFYLVALKKKRSQYERYLVDRFGGDKSNYYAASEIVFNAFNMLSSICKKKIQFR
jgi:putative GTP pyrophosphokinase